MKIDVFFNFSFVLHEIKLVILVIQTQTHNKILLNCFCSNNYQQITKADNKVQKKENNVGFTLLATKIKRFNPHNVKRHTS